MKSLWTPWRMAYVGAPRVEGRCPFCPPPAAADHRAALLLMADGVTAVFLNRFPYANGHLLVAPCRHVADLAELSPAELAALGNRLQDSVAILRRHLAPQGFNLGLNLGPVAGAGRADHLHVHVVPRWDGDHNFMTVLAEVRTIPEHIDATYDRLRPDFARLVDPGT
ncbi:MAG: HIT domain-containing protein [Thermodesulfobacteriota bacterium]